MPNELILAGCGLLAGAFGALLGLGGGILIVPILTLGFGVPLTTAVGTSLICVIATSTGAAAINVRAGRADVRLGITLAGGTVVGALTGGLLAGIVPERIVAGLFAALLAYTAATMARGLLRSSPVEELALILLYGAGARAFNPCARPRFTEHPSDSPWRFPQQQMESCNGDSQVSSHGARGYRFWRNHRSCLRCR